MRAKKSIVSFLMTLIMVLSMLVGCDSQEASPQKTSEDAKQNNATQETKKEEAEYQGNGEWTILVYLCGTDLESNAGAATNDLTEMIEAKTGDTERFVVQTGGCKKWQNQVVSNKKTERYEISKGDIKKLSSSKPVNMGESDSLKDFVQWGMKKYGKGKMGLILWDHGGGSVSGVCLDEKNNGDTLTLPEIDNALKGIDHKFNFIGCDACLMGTVEMASMLSAHASYMLGSEELESGCGWNYTSIGNTMAKNKNVDTVTLGKNICDSFMKDCKKIGEGDTTTLSLTDLSKIDAVKNAFDKVAKNINGSISDEAALGKISKGIHKAENYGGNTPSEGYTNMIDLGDVAKKISASVNTDELTAAIKDAVIYQVKGAKKKKSNGLSVYYPLKVTEKKELKTFEKVCVSDNYKNFIGAMVYGASNGDTSGYSEGSDWADVSQGEGYSTDEQCKIKIKEDLAIDEDDYYTFTIDKTSLPIVESVQYDLYMKMDKSSYFYLGSDNNVEVDWDTGVVRDSFSGEWPCLPDGSFLSMYVVEEDEEYTIFSSPILLNGKQTNLRFAYVYGEDEDDGEWVVLGAWDGIDSYGQAAKELKEICVGDEIVPIYTTVDANSGETSEVEGDVCKVKKDFNIVEEKLNKGTYYSNFSLLDSYGSTKTLDMMEFTVSKNGEVQTP